MVKIPSRLSGAFSDRYTLERELGEGGMATVYLADDLKHGRQVAIKVLKPELAAAVGTERFLSEIETTAGLQHPHILPLFDSGEADGFLYYVMPYVEGESLRDKLDREKQLPVEEAVRIAGAVAEALDHAHRHDVIHRDIKPANILLADGQPLVADFGIALAVDAAGGARLTETGLSLGTPYYMSPEQATGDQTVGPASDVYSLACVLYEMLTGDPPYVGSTAAAVLGKIITGEAEPAAAIRPTVPAHVDAALRKGLEKLPADRFTGAGRFARAVRDPSFRYGEGVPSRASGGGPWSTLGPAFAALFVVAAALAAWAFGRSTPSPVTRLMVTFEPEEELWYMRTANPSRVDITPDGSRFVYTGPGAADLEGMLWVREMDELRGRPLAGTENGAGPRISPDGTRLAYLVPVGEDLFASDLGRRAGFGIRVVPLAGGASVMVVEGPVYSLPAWADDEALYFMAGPVELARVSATGGAVDTVMTLPGDPEVVEHANPVPIDGDRGVIVTGLPIRSEGPRPSRVHVIDRETGEVTASIPGTKGFLTPAGDLAYVTTDGTLMVQAFNLDSLEPVGDPVPMERDLDVRLNGRWVELALSESGTLLYILETTQSPERWVWVDEEGRATPVDPAWTEDTEFEGMELSPDGRRLAVELQREGRWDIWIKRLSGGAPARLTFRGQQNREPAWSPDGSRIAFVSRSEEGWNAWVRRADGSGAAEPLLDLEQDIREVLWTPDGERLLVVVEAEDHDIVSVDADAGEPTPLLTGPHREMQPAISPDGRWLAYTSMETGRHEVFVVPFPDVGAGRWQMSTTGGREPRWSHDGSRLFIRHGDGSGIDVVDMSGGPGSAERRTFVDMPDLPWYELNFDNHLYDVTPDGRIIMLNTGTLDQSGNLVVVHNWLADVEARLEGGR